MLLLSFKDICVVLCLFVCQFPALFSLAPTGDFFCFGLTRKKLWIKIRSRKEEKMPVGKPRRTVLPVLKWYNESEAAAMTARYKNKNAKVKIPPEGEIFQY